MRDVTFRSSSLGREIQYRVVVPASITQGEKLPVVYLLHGGGADFHSWTNDSDVARFAEYRLVLVMPEGGSSYYVNSVEHLHDRYEDYIVNDVIADSQNKFPIAAGREHRAIVGISMGGFGAVNLSLRHPDLFAFVGALSPAVDVPSRPFSIKRIGQWREHSSIFGPWGSETRRANDPYLLVASVDPAVTPYFYVSCGEQEGLLPANRKLARLFADHRFRFEFHAGPGGHNWNQWNARLPDLFRSLAEHIQQTR
jgi:putative tributyrin esterase